MRVPEASLLDLKSEHDQVEKARMAGQDGMADGLTEDCELRLRTEASKASFAIRV